MNTSTQIDARIHFPVTVYAASTTTTITITVSVAVVSVVIHCRRRLRSILLLLLTAMIAIYIYIVENFGKYVYEEKIKRIKCMAEQAAAGDPKQNIQSFQSRIDCRFVQNNPVIG